MDRMAYCFPNSDSEKSELSGCIGSAVQVVPNVSMIDDVNWLARLFPAIESGFPPVSLSLLADARPLHLSGGYVRRGMNPDPFGGGRPGPPIGRSLDDSQVRARHVPESDGTQGIWSSGSLMHKPLKGGIMDISQICSLSKGHYFVGSGRMTPSHI